MLLASVSALLALYNSSAGNRQLGPIILIPAVALSYVVPFRLKRQGPARWILRAALMLIVLLTAPVAQQTGRVWWTDESVTQVLGLLAAMELVLQHWLGEPSGPRHGIMLWLAAGVFTAATNTYEKNAIVYLAPTFALCSAGILRVFRPQRQMPASTAFIRPRLRSNIARATAVALALGLGLLITMGVEHARDALNRIGSAWLPHFMPSQGVGMSASDRLMSHYNLFPSKRRALRVMGSQRPMHLRGMAFDRYEQNTWFPQLQQRLLDPAPLLFAPGAEGESIRILRLADNLNLLYLPLQVGRVQVEEGASLSIERGHRAVVTSLTEAGDPCTYDLIVPRSPEAQGPLCRELTGDERETCLEVPAAVRHAIKQVAPQLTATQPKKTILNVASHLQQNHTYSLQAKLSGADFLADFLLNKRSAHCQYFASAAVMLLRYSGIPARYVTGYYAHEPYGANELVVRQRDAHAWTEAWLDGVGWVTLDMTPASGTPAEQFEQVNWFQRWREKLADGFAAAMQWLRHIEWRLIALVGVVLVFFALMLQSLLDHLRRRRLPPPRTYAFPGAELKAIADEFGAVLKSLGEAPLESATWTEHLASQAAQTSRSRRQVRLQAAADFVAVYNRTRFGDPDNPEALIELRRHLATVKETA
jgi:hypothetical protein